MNLLEGRREVAPMLYSAVWIPNTYNHIYSPKGTTLIPPQFSQTAPYTRNTIYQHN